MDNHTQSGKARKPLCSFGSLPPQLTLLLLLAVGLLVGLNGCMRRFYRNQADKDVSAILGEKDQYPQWKIEQYHVYPDPLARFADLSNPDRPPMPPDDPAARDLSPNPQKPGKAGVARIEGTGYLELLAQWDAENRAALAKADAPLLPSADYSGPAYGRQAQSVAAETASAEGKAYLITLDQAVELGLVNSREYQNRREDLYLSALPVTLERFAFSAQFFATEQFLRQWTGRQATGGPSNRWVADGVYGAGKLFSTGGLLLVRFANRTVVELTNFNPRQPLKHTTSLTNFDLNIIQPLLRGGGKAVTLEPLTEVERGLLYEVRSYARFRKEFYVAIAGGGDILSAAGGFGAGSALSIPAVVAPGARFEVTPGASGRVLLAGGQVALTQGFLPTLFVQAQLSNERKNVANLEGLVRMFQAFREGGDISQLQVDQVELDLLRGRTQILTQQQNLRDAVDRLKIQLGLPTDLPIELDNSPLAAISRQLKDFEDIVGQFETARKQAGEMDQLEDAVETVASVLAVNPLAPDPRAAALTAIANPTQQAPGPLFRSLRGRLRRIATESRVVQGTRFREDFPRRWTAWEALPPARVRGDVAAQLAGLPLALGQGNLVWAALLLEPELPMRSPVLDRIGELIRERNKLRDYKAEFDRVNKPVPVEVEQRLAEFDYEIDLGRFEQALRLYETQPWIGRANQRLAYGAFFREAVNLFVLVLSQARSERFAQTRQRWPNVPSVEVSGTNVLQANLEEVYTAASQYALSNRFDLMNERARMVDAWRQLTVFANALLGTFNVEYHQNVTTPPGQAQPLAFAGSTSRHELILNTELPLIRVPERNNYRAAVIAYQRRRRVLMAVEDFILLGIRQQVRQLRQLAENFRIQQRAVELAYLQVENSLEVLVAPPVPTQSLQIGGGGAGNAAALTQQLLNAQNRLLQAQNALYAAWINFHIARMEFYRDLELMPLDFRGVWNDELATDRTGGPDGRAGPADPATPPAKP